MTKSAEKGNHEWKKSDHDVIDLEQHALQPYKVIMSYDVGFLFLKENLLVHAM